MRLFAAARKDAGRAAAQARVKRWTRERFALQPEDAVLVAEIACTLPGCPPLETAVVFWSADGTEHRFKVFKRLAEVVHDDLPYAWLKGALAEASEFECC